ncbi:MAG: Hsp20/alpha crystallin family protein [Cyanobacteria bacterium P01_G01_bin.39]
MTIIRYSPWSEIDTLQRQFERVFNEASAPTTKVPAAEIIETDQALILRLELPGIKTTDINIEATARSISVSGERKSDQEGRTKSEFHYGSFQRVVPLPVRIQNTEVKADYKDGILHLTLPKAQSELNKVVKVSLN